ELGSLGLLLADLRRSDLRQAQAIAFTSQQIGAKAVEEKVYDLRRALEPEANTIADIPQFDVGLVHELYALRLQPVEQAWKPTKHRIVVTNGALGLLPLSLLPTEAVKINETEPYFASYRQVPWLARTHAITMVPSTAAFRTLRALPVASAKRERFMGFGDPFFNAQQLAEKHPARPGSASSCCRPGHAVAATIVPADSRC